MTEGNSENGIMTGLYYEGTKSFWHRAPVKTKLFCSALLLLGLVLSVNISILVVNTLFLLTLAVVPGPGIALLRRLKPFVFFSLFIVLFHSLLNPANTTTWGWLGWEGFLYGSTVALRLVSIVGLAQLFLMTTPPGVVFRYFSSWHRDMGLIMLLLMGFLPVLKEEMTTTMQAQQTRGLHWQTLLERLQAYLTMIIPVIIKSLYRAQGMASLLLLRGYGENQDVQTHFTPAWTKGYYWIVALSSCFCAANLVILLRSRLMH